MSILEVGCGCTCSLDTHSHRYLLNQHRIPTQSHSNNPLHRFVCSLWSCHLLCVHALIIYRPINNDNEVYFYCHWIIIVTREVCKYYMYIKRFARWWGTHKSVVGMGEGGVGRTWNWNWTTMGSEVNNAQSRQREWVHLHPSYVLRIVWTMCLSRLDLLLY